MSYKIIITINVKQFKNKKSWHEAICDRNSRRPNRFVRQKRRLEIMFSFFCQNT
jgi:hypothetical protein